MAVALAEAVEALAVAEPAASGRVRIKEVVMNKILISLTVIFSFAFTQANFPELSGAIIDKSSLLSEVARSDLSRRIKEHEAKYGNKLIVVTVKLKKEEQIASYAQNLAKHWNIGDDTAVLVVSYDSKEYLNSRAIIVTKGDWLKGDLITSEIIEAKLRERNIDGAFKLGVIKTLEFMDDDKSNDYINHPYEDATIAMLVVSVFGGLVLWIVSYKFDLFFLIQVGISSVLSGMLTVFLMKALPYGIPSFLFFGIVFVFTLLTMRIEMREDGSRYVDLGFLNSLFGVKKVKEV
ncbi:TPM domain-containing protein [Campylobacter sp.]|uniref:TPM domain-containing protein n=1 Tax=Campylobacter sp. TaxID=205 RepID=UPI00270D5AEF|nr:TPM domain-containing protein [Campylobacter sp.]